MDLTVIIPINEFNEVTKELYDIAIESVRKQDKVGDRRPKILVVYAAELESNELFDSELKRTDNVLTIEYIKNEGKTDFQSQINLGVEHVDTTYFTFLEFDDEFNSTYMYQAENYFTKMTDVDLFLPMIVEVNSSNRGVKFTNEVVWSKQFVGENGTVGFLNLSAINQYSDFKINGGIFNTESFKMVGGLKSNIKLTFTYELLLRMLNNGDKIFIIPKIGYKHIADRIGSLFMSYADEGNPNFMSFAERKFWFNTAKKEANFHKDREIDTSILTQ